MDSVAYGMGTPFVLSVGVEKAQFGRLGVVREQREVDPATVPNGAARKRRARALTCPRVRVLVGHLKIFPIWSDRVENAHRGFGDL